MCGVVWGRWWLGAIAATVLLTWYGIRGSSAAVDAAGGSDDPLAARYAREIQPLLAKYCHQCHSGDLTEAELDFGDYPTLAAMKPRQKVWLRIREVIETGDMPPPEGKQPKDAERLLMKRWVGEFLEREALADAGDPGPVGLRRLDNSEYTYAIRDLTGVPDLDPAKEFPVDGAAGEGFTNVASGRGMPPAMVRKYLDAGKRVAGHLVFLPDGVRFSKADTRRDQTDELLDRIRAFYARYTAGGGGEKFNLQGVQFESNQGGLLPVENVLTALLAEREAIRNGRKSLEVVAKDWSLSAKYLEQVWKALELDGQPDWSPLGRIQAQWRRARSENAAAEAGKIAQEIAHWQQVLWKFSPVGQVGREGGAKRWMEPVEPIVARQELRFGLPAAVEQPGGARTVRVAVAVDALGDGAPADREQVVWRQPRIEFPAAKGAAAHPPIALRDLPAVVAATRMVIEKEWPRSAEYLAAVAAFRQGDRSIDEVARASQLRPTLLARWTEVLGFGSASRRIDGLLTQKSPAVAGYASINGWSGPNALGLMTNSSKEDVAITTLVVPARGVTVHPSPEQAACVIWRAPVAGKFRVAGLVADADNKCGNGTSWRVEQRSLKGAVRLAGGDLDNGARTEFRDEGDVVVAVDDLIVLVVDPRQRDHVCDTTQIELTIREVGGEREWTLSREIVDRVLEGNPLPDLAGNPAVWHFCGTSPATAAGPEIPPMSRLAQWKAAVLEGRPAADVTALATECAGLLTSKDVAALSDADRAVRSMLANWRGPLRWAETARDAVAGIAPAAIEAVAVETGIDPKRFGPLAGADPAGVAASDFVMTGGTRWGVAIPADLAEGGELVASVEPGPGPKAAEVSLQVRVEAAAESIGLSELGTNGSQLVASQPVIAVAGSPAAERWRQALRAVGDLFPPALCYTKIVPVDEVVTLTLYHREDDHLKRLMLNEQEIAELDKLWAELLFVAHEPVELEVALEQLIQFATQDRQDLVPPFQAMVPVVAGRAREFEQQLVAAQPAQLQSALAFAPRAWRRPLTPDEAAGLTHLYDNLRAANLDHEAAVRLVVARILTAPEFLFKLEQAGSGTAPTTVSPRELAARLSFFLWSSLPDDELIAEAAAGRLIDDATLISQTRRMLRDDRARRMAIHFACQWMHIRDFATNNDKNESLFPEFAELRGDMFEETVLFCDDLIRNDRSILSLLDADHTFVNERLAKHYGLTGPSAGATEAGGVVNVTGAGWSRVEGLRGAGRGGVLGMATILASQSGASRTSPILRGNWVFETLLGDRLPKPPPGVPQLPEAVPEGLNERQMIEKHSSVAACARCHVKIDALGFALEAFDPIGRTRPQPGDLSAQLADGTKFNGLPGLKAYLSTARRDEFVRHFCKKLLGYALGREVRLSDEPLLKAMGKRLAENDYRFQTAVETIVLSPQFRTIRGADRVEPE